MERINWVDAGAGTWRCLDCTREFIKTEYVGFDGKNCSICQRAVSAGVGDVCFSCYSIQLHLPQFLKTKNGLSYCLSVIKKRMND